MIDWAAWETSTCPPHAAAQIRAARCTASPVYIPPDGTACPVWTPIRTRTRPSAGQAWAASARWIASAHSTACLAPANATKNASPWVSTS